MTPRQPQGNDLNKSYHEIGRDVLSDMKDSAKATVSPGRQSEMPLPKDPNTAFEEALRQYSPDNEDERFTDKALSSATERVFNEVISKLPQQQVVQMSADDAAKYLFGNKDAASSLGNDFEKLTAEEKMNRMSQVVEEGLGFSSDGEAADESSEASGEHATDPNEDEEMQQEFQNYRDNRR